MTDKQKFIDLVDSVFRKVDMEVFIGDDENAIAGYEYFKKLKDEKSEPSAITETGMKIIEFMKLNSDKNYTAKEIADGLFTSSRSVSGSMRKLVTDGYCSKNGKDPVIYSLTEEGKNL